MKENGKDDCEQTNTPIHMELLRRYYVTKNSAWNLAKDHISSEILFKGRKRPPFHGYHPHWVILSLLLCVIASYCVVEAGTERELKFEWKTGLWGECESTSCGHGGIQLRPVTCVYEKSELSVIQSKCHQRSKPIDQRKCFKVCDEHKELFRWKVHAWMKCVVMETVPHDRSSGKIDKCGLGFAQYGSQFRNISCIGVEDETVLMENYVCQKFSSPPSNSRSCEVPCPVNCVTSHWTGWSKCSKSCGNGTRYRTRDVITKEDFGGLKCPRLSEIRPCPDLPECQTDPIIEAFFRHALRFGVWSECEAAEEITLPSNGRRRKENRRRLAYVQKDLIGERERHVTCLDEDGTSMGESTTVSETCTMTKDCETNEWSDWSVCIATCGVTGNRSRVRRIKSLPTGPGALDCPPLEEIEECKMDQNRIRICKNYTWATGGWSECETANNASCGGGTRQRSVYCVVRDEFTIYHASAAVAIGGKNGLTEWAKMKPVNDEDCDLKYKPPIWEECDSPCSPKCEVGQWSDWSECNPEFCTIATPSPGSPQALSSGKKLNNGFKMRVRKILENNKDIDGCVHTAEVIPCDDAKCFRWQVTSISSCLPSNGYCGEGKREQTYECRDVWGKIVDDDKCKRSSTDPAPSSVPCHYPCGSDCVVDEWSSWTLCTHVCKRGRTESRNQTRFRQILANHGPGGKECPSVADLKESRVCNQHRCSVYYWDVGSWAKCQVKDSVTPAPSSVGVRTSDMFMSDDGNSTRWSHKPLSFPSDGDVPICGTGYQIREVNCRKKDSATVHDDRCGNKNMKPLISRDCNFLCPRDCVVSEWSKWSDCETECEKVAKPRQGSPGPLFQQRHRVVVQHRTGRGMPCPMELEQKRQCIETEKCMLYRWHISKWSHCAIIMGASSLLGGGQTTCVGAMTRKVQCRQFSLNGESMNVDYELCIKYSEKPAPETSQHCFAKCRPNKDFAEWQNKISCLATMENLELTKISKKKSKDGAEDSFVTLQKTSKPIGEWSSCNITKPNAPSSGFLLGRTRKDPYCGTGSRRRALGCFVEGTDIMVENSHCYYRNFQEQSCTIPCPVDCKMSSWSSWGRCGDKTVGRTSKIEAALPCGKNIQLRYNIVSTQPSNGGRPCPIVDSMGLQFESKPCRTVCNDFFWVPSSWKQCDVINNGAFSNCGSGLQSRQVKCYETDRDSGYSNVAKPVDVHLCELNQMPFGSRRCNSSCPGECVYSEWGTWQPCTSTVDRRDPNTCDGVRKRTRTLLRKSDPDVVLQQDETMLKSLCEAKNFTEKVEPCELNRNCFAYSAMWTRWSSCLLPSGAACGTGRKERGANCVSSTGLPVDKTECLKNHVEIPGMERESCHVECALDCIVSEWSSWSRCSASCGSSIVKTRTRQVQQEATLLGRSCPVTVETTPCPPKPCHKWVLGDWSECQVSGDNCGTGLQFRKVNCVQHDGVVVSEVLCQNQHDDVDQSLGESKLRQDCSVACAGECHLTEWSQWSDCHLRCHDTDIKVSGVVGGIQARSRVGFIVGQVNEGECPPQEVQERFCDIDDADCFLYKWKTGIYNKGKRPVWCQRNVDSLNVSSGCDERLKPQEKLYCIQNCDTIANSYCTDNGICECDDGYHAQTHSTGTLISCKENQLNDEATVIKVTKLSDIELNSRSVTRYKNIDTKLTDTTTTTSEEIMTTEIMLKKTGFWDDFDIFTEGGQLKVWVYGAIAGFAVFLIFIIAVTYLAYMMCCRKKKTKYNGGSRYNRKLTGRRKRRNNSSGSNVGVGMVIGSMGTPRVPASTSAMSHTSSTSRSGYSTYPDHYGSGILWKEY